MSKSAVLDVDVGHPPRRVEVLVASAPVDYVVGPSVPLLAVTNVVRVVLESVVLGPLDFYRVPLGIRRAHIYVYCDHA